VAGDTIWKEEKSSAPPLSLALKKDESLDQAIQREMQGRNEAVGVKAIANIPLPTYIARMPKLDEKK
jgi:hypothetical protein